MPTCDLAQQVFAQLGASESGSFPFIAVPGSGEPRWLLPTGGNIDSVLSNWMAYRLSSQIKWTAIRAAARLGALTRLPNAVQLNAGGVDSIEWRRWGWYGRTPPLPVVYVGTPGACRKAVVHLVDRRSGACRMVLKVPLSERASAAILREAGVLNALARESRVRVPRLLEADYQLGIASQAFIAGTPGNRRLTAEHCGLLGSLLLENEVTTIADHAAALRERVLLSPMAAQVRNRLNAGIAQLLSTRLLPACWVHGDFAPWNIRHGGNSAPVLIDWESAHRGGLPLHDAFHFLHMQDYLFPHRPQRHWADVQAYGFSLGLSAEECRQLEIAYLVYAHMGCVEQEENRRAEFYLTALELVLQTPRRRWVEVTAATDQAPAQASRGSQVRQGLFATVLAEFNAAGIPYCLLGGYENQAAFADSDVDVMVAPDKLTHVQGLLAQAAHASGAMLVQAIQHESSACYFVLAKADGTGYAFLDVDCCGDYLRRGRLWLRAEAILARRKRCRTFFVPATPDQFLYYVIKKVLKQSISTHQLKYLLHLYARDPAACQRKLVEYWQPATAHFLQRAIAEQNLPLMQDRLPELLSELNRSKPIGGSIGRWTTRLYELARRTHRVLQPTGMAVCITGGDEWLQSEVSQLLISHLSPVFRRTGGVALRATLPDFFVPPCVWLARMRSTLTVMQVSGAPLTGTASRLIRLLRPDVILHLETGSEAERTEKTPVIYCDAALPAGHIAEQAAHMILPLMASRIESRRLTQDRRNRATAYPPPAAPAQSSFPGSD